MRPVVVIEHGPDDPPGFLGEWLDDREIPWLVRRRDDAQDAMPDASALVSLGSSHAAYEPTAWVQAHIELLRQAAADTPVLGLCFGAQALSIALGGDAHRAAEPEIGWVKPEGSVDALDGPWFSWHFDTLTPPAGAAVLATTERAVQAYTDRHHVGLQFHPEVTAAIARGWIDNDPETAGRHGGPGLRQSLPAAEPALRMRAFGLFDWWRSYTGI